MGTRIMRVHVSLGTQARTLPSVILHSYMTLFVLYVCEWVYRCTHTHAHTYI